MTNNVAFDYEAYIKQHFHYSNGILTRDDRKNSNGSLDKDGYLIIKVKTKQFKAHRIVWLLHYGKFPAMEIDHINHNRTDNRIENLREVDRQGNIDNIRLQVNPQTGYVGISCDNKTKGLRAKYTFRHEGKTYRFRNLEDAVKEKERLKHEC